jgi:hypothetical protein
MNRYPLWSSRCRLKLTCRQRNMVKSREIIPFVMIEAEESIGIDTV